MYPIASHTLKQRVEKICTALYRWSPCLAGCVWLPKFVFPWANFFGTHVESAFETCVVLLKSFENCVLFRNFLPNRELYIINCIIENFFHLPGQPETTMADIAQFNQNHPCMKDMDGQMRYIFGLFASFFTEQLSGDEWLKLVDHIFLSQNVLFVYIILAVFAAREMNLVFRIKIQQKHLRMDRADEVLRIAYIIYDHFNAKHNPDIYGDQPLLTAKKLRMRAIDDFDKSFDMKPLRLVDFNCLPEPIVIPKMRIRDLTREVDDVERTFRDAYDCGMRDSHSYHS